MNYINKQLLKISSQPIFHSRHKTHCTLGGQTRRTHIGTQTRIVFMSLIFHLASETAFAHHGTHTKKELGILQFIYYCQLAGNHFSLLN